ncbi:MAG: hypothetical protein NC203_09085, partial [Firmicutes bacterium]|nr:hypothetical protein [Bacillota bacterium]
MKPIIKTFVGLAAASVAAVSVLTVSALAVASKEDLLKLDAQGTARENIMTVSESVNDVRYYANSYVDGSSSKKYMDIYINGGGDNNNTAYTSMYAYPGYQGNYKFVSIAATNDNG